MDCESIQREIAATVRRTKEDCPFVPSITNSVTMELVANAQLAAGGSAAMVYLPDDYDGLVFAAMPQLDNYKDCARRMQLDSIAPEASIMDIDLVDPYNTLFFSICY